MTDLLILFLNETWIILNEASPWVLLGFTVAALLKAFVSDDFIARHLGRNGTASVLKASLIGVPLPLCSCGVVPAALGLRRQGASKGATTAFLISTPETGVDSMAVTWALLDPVMTVVRPVAAFFTATLAGLAVNALPDEPAPKTLETATPAASCGCNSGCCGAPKQTPATLGAKLRTGFSHAFGDMLADIGMWLLVGIVVAAAISAFVPPSVFELYLGNEGLAMLLMLLAGVPLYVCATASTPIAASLALKGLSPGAALVFLLAGPATNAATIGVVAKSLGRRAAVVYVGAIAVSSLLLGWLVNRLYSLLGLDIASWVASASDQSATWFTALCSVALLALVARAMFGSGHDDHHACSHPAPAPAIDSSTFKVR